MARGAARRAGKRWLCGIVGAAWVALGAACGAGDAGTESAVDGGAPAPPLEAGDARTEDAGPGEDDGAARVPDAGDAGTVDPRFATRVVSFTPGACAGFGAGAMPGVVLGPPRGAGASQGSLDVVSLGSGGEIVLSVEPNAIVDGPGVDLLVFENAFRAGGSGEVFADLGEVSVSEDGLTWKTWPCTATAPPYGACAGWHPVFASPTNGVSPTDPATSGGDPFDLADVGLTRARFVRIRDVGGAACGDGGAGPGTNGFDLDALAVVHGELP